MERLHLAYPTPSLVQIMSEQFQYQRKLTAAACQRLFVCGCDLCQEMLQKEIPYFQSIMDDMLLAMPPPPRYTSKIYSNCKADGTFTDYVPLTSPFSRVWFSVVDADFEEMEANKWVRCMKIIMEFQGCCLRLYTYKYKQRNVN